MYICLDLYIYILVRITLNSSNMALYFTYAVDDDDPQTGAVDQLGSALVFVCHICIVMNHLMIYIYATTFLSILLRLTLFCLSLIIFHYCAYVSVFVLLHFPVFLFASVGLALVHLTVRNGTGVPENYAFL